MIFGDITEIYYMHIFFYLQDKNITDIDGVLILNENTYIELHLHQISHFLPEMHDPYQYYPLTALLQEETAAMVAWRGERSALPS